MPNLFYSQLNFSQNYTTVFLNQNLNQKKMLGYVIEINSNENNKAKLDIKVMYHPCECPCKGTSEISYELPTKGYEDSLSEIIDHSISEFGLRIPSNMSADQIKSSLKNNVDSAILALTQEQKAKSDDLNLVCSDCQEKFSQLEI